MSCDSFKYSPPINVASVRETPTNAYSIRSDAKSSLRVFSKPDSRLLF